MAMEERLFFLNGLIDGPQLEWADSATKAAMDAGEVLRELYEKPHRVRYKGAIDLVTEADTASEEVIKKILARRHPDVAIMAEESSSPDQKEMEGPVWIVDPLDGTTNFAHGFPWFCVSIAFYRRGGAEVGVIYCPMQDELFCGIRGVGAWLNGKPISVSTVEALSQSLLATGFPYDVQKDPDQVVKPLRRMLLNAQGIRRAGAAAMDLAYVACGRLDGFWELKLKPWDTAAGQLLVEEAGGRVTDFRGRTYNPFLKEILASNGRIHDEMVKLLR